MATQTWAEAAGGAVGGRQGEITSTLDLSSCGFNFQMYKYLTHVMCVCVCVFKVTEGLHCVSPELCELTSGTLTLSLEVPEETAVK